MDCELDVKKNLTLVLIIAAGCHGLLPTESTDTRSLTINTLASTKQSAMTSRRGEVIVDATRLQSVWTEAGLAGQPIPPVDLSREMVILAAPGTQPDSCVNVAITSVAAGQGQIAIRVEQQRPPDSCSCPPFQVTPLHLVKTIRVSGSPEFTFQRVTVGNC